MHHIVSGIPATPIRALDKTLRDGRHLTLDLVPRDEDSGYWMNVEIDGAPMGGHFIAGAERDASPVPGLPHVIKVPTQPGKASRRQPMGLTGTEADAVENAQAEWHGRHHRALLAAAPDAPTMVRATWHPGRPGDVVNLDGEFHVVLERISRRWIEEDGRSLGLDSEEGYLYDLRVRELTDGERARLAAYRSEDEGRFREAVDKFGEVHKS